MKKFFAKMTGRAGAGPGGVRADHRAGVHRCYGHRWGFSALRSWCVHHNHVCAARSSRYPGNDTEKRAGRRSDGDRLRSADGISWRGGTGSRGICTDPPPRRSGRRCYVDDFREHANEHFIRRLLTVFNGSPVSEGKRQGLPGLRNVDVMIPGGLCRCNGCEGKRWNENQFETD